MDWPGPAGVSLAEAPAWISGGQECKGHRQCGSGQPGLLSAKWRGRHVCHVLVARGRHSHADREAGGGLGLCWPGGRSCLADSNPGSSVALGPTKL